MTELPPIRVMVVDDDAESRALISQVLGGCEDIRVVGVSTDGHRALLDAERLRPDVITLDLEMPHLGGFAFLRLLMARRPTPVIVVSGRGERDQVFRALELGALDFVAKPGASPEATVLDLRSRLLMCVRSVRRLTKVRVSQHCIADTKQAPRLSQAERGRGPRPARSVACVAASTGGPGVIETMLRGLAPGFEGTIVIAQHMPARFTESFAARLDRRCAVAVREARDGERLMTGEVLVAPGQRNVILERRDSEVIVRVVTPGGLTQGLASLAPNADVLFGSAAAVFGTAACAVVLSGMGTDGLAGSGEIAKAGGRVLVQEPASAVLPSMPSSVVESGSSTGVHPVADLAGELGLFFVRFA